ncbi:MAG: cation-translocating P-type ATPase [Elainella sp. Prado103]|jgi:Ca2+-transporting ATPase|nr:cation-translocating P-type ATPase [Elainella sp. Prado103]
MSDWYQQQATQVAQALQTNEQAGLSQTEAQNRQHQYGLNELAAQPPKSPWLMLWEQFTSTTVLVLIVAGVITLFLGEYEDAIAIFAVVIFNAILGFTQEYRAGKEFAALRKLAIPKARVWRDSQWQMIDSRELVPGDIVQLEDGDQVPADGRIFENTNLRTQEAAFTGESESIEKSVPPIEGDDLPLGDRRNMVFMGTVVTYGRAKAIVTETGMNSELGKIAHSMQTVETEQTPLQRRLDQLGKRLAVAALLLVAIIFGFGVLRGENLTEMFLTAVSLAVAIIPEGLPAVVTIALAIGARRMLKRHALIRKLPAVETLGSVTTICSDKTGTLTENRMTVTILSLAGKRIDLRESYAQLTSRLEGHRSQFPAGAGSPMEAPLSLTLVGSALCNNAMVPDADESIAPLLSADTEDIQLPGTPMPDTLAGIAEQVASPIVPHTQTHTQTQTQTQTNTPSAETGKAIGDPTEIALVVAADRMGLDKDDLEDLFPRVAEAPFDSDRKRMTTIHRFGQQDWSSEVAKQIANLKTFSQQPYIAFTKGAVDSLLEVSTQIWQENGTLPLDADRREQVKAENDKMAAMGTRVLGVAFRWLDQPPAAGQELTAEQDLILVGLVGLLDPARPEAKAAVQTCNAAGIRTVMITGDHPLMAKHIAEELEISQNGQFLTGQQLNQLTEADLVEKVATVSVYARVSPEQKLNIVDAFQQRGQIVSMTGDGVNDAPALSKANIGVAMGIAGTDVAKEAADMVLLNDNFATIVAAVEEGRVIYDNIRKFIRYTLTGNTSTVVIMLLAPLLSLPQPLRPTQILWINLLADGLLALALSVEPGEKDVMQRPPYPPNESVFSRGVGRDIVLIGILLGLALLGFGYYVRSIGWESWQTMIFASLAFSRIFLALAMRSERDPLIRKGIFSNRLMLLAVVITFMLQISVIYTPWLQPIFQTQPLLQAEILLGLAVSTFGFWIVEFQKLILPKTSQSP